MNNVYFYIETIFDLKNTKKFRQELENSINSALIPGLFSSYLEEKGVSFSLNYQKDLSYENFMYDEISLTIDADYQNLDLEDIDDPDVMITVLEIIEEFIENIKIQMHYKNNRCYMVMGKKTLSLLQEIVYKDAFPGETLTDSSFYTYIESRIPDTIHSIGHCSITNLLSYGRNIPEVSEYLKDLIQKPGIIWYTRYKKNSSEIALFWDIEEISYLVTIAGKILHLIFDEKNKNITMR